MGAWGMGTFENDAAGDWVFGLEASRDKSLVLATLQAAKDSDDPFFDEGSEALAAAEVVLAATTGDRGRVPEEVSAWLDRRYGLLKKRTVTFDAADARLAVGAVSSVMKSSALRDSWEEVPEFDAWLEATGELRQSLEACSGSMD